MIELTGEERERFAAWLRDRARSTIDLIRGMELMGSLNPSIGRTLKAEADACAITAGILIFDHREQSK